MLLYIQHKLGGTIKLRSGDQSVRWRLHSKKGLLDLLTRVNGYIRHSSRLVQLNRLTSVLGLQVLSPDSLECNHAWFSGFFDAVGSIESYSKESKDSTELTISVTNKLYADVLHFYNCFGGNVYFNKGLNGYYK